MKNIPMLDLKRQYEYMKEGIDHAISACLDHQKWILGPEVDELEATVAGYLHVRHCVGVSSGTDALVLALRALAIQTKGQEYFNRSDRIITTPFTFTATGDAILRAGATPVFVDIDPCTYNIDPTAMEECLVQRSKSDFADSRVVGAIPVHLYGRPCEMDRILELADRFGLFILEDAAQAFGATWKGKKVGTLGSCGAFSFFPSKNLGGFGDAGMVATDSDETAELVRMLLRHGGKDKYNVDHVGYNGRIDTLQAAILLAKSRLLDDFNERRRHIAQEYTIGLRCDPEMILPVTRATSGSSGRADPHFLLPPGHVFHQYTVRVQPDKREIFRRELQDRGIDTMIYYPFPLHKMKVFGGGRSLRGTTLSHAESACSSVFSLPIDPLQTEEETGYILEQTNRLIDRAGKQEKQVATSQ